MYDEQRIYVEPENNGNAPKRPKKKNLGGFIAAVLAITIIGGGAGFGGAYLSNSLMSEQLTAPIFPSQENAAPNDSDTTSGAPTLDELQADVTQATPSVDSTSTQTTYKYTNSADLVSKVRTQIVYVTTYITYRGELSEYSGGSGIIISKDGYIVTNNHVVEGAEKLKVTVTNSADEKDTTDYDATLLGRDKSTDLAVLKIEAKDLNAAALGDSDKLLLGEDVVAIGNPAGLNGSVTKGIVSGLDRYFEVTDDRTLSSIQTDAAINYGNSGGALYNMNGDVVGIVNSKVAATGYDNIGFAITINEAKVVINDLLSKGYVSGRPILGITCMQISEYIAAAQNMTAGLLVSEINANMPVAESGLKVGDTITKINGTNVYSVAEVSEILKDMKPGDSVQATIIRTDSIGNLKESTISIELSEYQGS